MAPVNNDVMVATMNNSKNLNAMLDDREKRELAESRLEALEKAGKAFDRIDINRNGEIERQEVSQMAKQGLGGLSRFAHLDDVTREAKVDKFIQDFDSNHDGKIQRSEWLEFYGKLFDSVVE